VCLVWRWPDCQTNVGKNINMPFDGACVLRCEAQDLRSSCKSCRMPQFRHIDDGLGRLRRWEAELLQESKKVIKCEPIINKGKFSVRQLCDYFSKRENSDYRKKEVIWVVSQLICMAQEAPKIQFYHNSVNKNFVEQGSLKKVPKNVQRQISLLGLTLRLTS